MAWYVLVVLASISLIGGVGQPIKTLVALAPLIPAAFALFAYLRFVSRMDELGQRIQLEALAFGFGAAGMLTFAYGFLEGQHSRGSEPEGMLTFEEPVREGQH